MILKFKVGGVYVNRLGDVCLIVGKRKGYVYPFLDGEGNEYTEDGKYWSDRDDDRDLIKEAGGSE